MNVNISDTLVTGSAAFFFVAFLAGALALLAYGRRNNANRRCLEYYAWLVCARGLFRSAMLCAAVLATAAVVSVYILFDPPQIPEVVALSGKTHNSLGLVKATYVIEIGLMLSAIGSALWAVHNILPLISYGKPVEIDQKQDQPGLSHSTN